MAADLAPTVRVGFKRHLRVEVVAGDAVYVLSPHGVKVLHGDQIEALAPLLDGTRTLPALLREAEAAVPVVAAGRVLGQLAEAGLIGYHRAGPGGGSDSASLAYWDLLGVDAEAATRSVAEKQVRIITVGGVGGRPGPPPRGGGGG
ncbi:hypothetical protein U9R90_29230, partial [Streptomyces sp. E11-3]